MQICTRQFPSSNNLQSSSAHTSRTLMYRNIVSGLNNVLCIQRKNNVVELAPEEITISSPLGGSFSSHACVTQSYPLHRRLISLRMTSVRRKLAHPSISKSTSPPASVSFVLSQWWILSALPTVNKSQLHILPPKWIYSGTIKNCNTVHVDMASQVHVREQKEAGSSFHRAGKEAKRRDCYSNRTLL